MPDSPCLDILLCPACRHTALAASGGALQCTACGRQYPLTDGMPDFRLDTRLDTKLARIDYDDHHGIDADSRESLCENWQGAFAACHAPWGDVLELGSGTGQLSWGLAHHFPFRSLHACDISAKFLATTRSVVCTAPIPAHYYVCDANHLPFRNRSFDTVVGNSVLHHFIDYPEILRRVHGLLRPGGVAIFYEPVLQGKIMIAFLADLILRTETHTGLAGLDENDKDILRRITRHITKAKHIGNDRQQLEAMEDKYIFDIHAMQALGQAAGYSAVDYRNSRLEGGRFRINLWNHLQLAGIDTAKLEKFRFILNAFKENLIDMTPQDMVTPMGFFLFRR